ncbi:MAG: agmatinase [Methanosphaera sp. rholeuAM270]|nr:MAG: agmatinase [Methanosphaera sp. rholeuAM270]
MFFYTENMSKFAFSEEIPEKNSFDSGYAIFGVSFDSTTSYKAGARYGPKAVREASYNFESYNLHFDSQLTAASYDIGDVNVDYGNYEKTHLMIVDTVMSLLRMGLKPIMIGGEHTVTNGVLQAFHDYDEDYFHNLTIVHLDAHFDLRDEYLGEKYSHATVLRRIHELKPREIIQLGIRSAQKEEYEYVKSQDNISYYTNYDIRYDFSTVLKRLEKIDTPIYITVDIDVLDPAYAPSVGTPSPCGINPFELEQIMLAMSKKDIIGLDVVEVSSDTVGDPTSINAAQVIYDLLCLKS